MQLNSFRSLCRKNLELFTDRTRDEQGQHHKHNIRLGLGRSHVEQLDLRMRSASISMICALDK